MKTAPDDPHGKPATELIEADDVQLAWGNRARWKARWRDESLRRHLDRPIAERLRTALSLVLRRSHRERRPT